MTSTSDIDPSLVWYVAGPMTGIPEHNFPAFRAVTSRMREQGTTVLDPSEIDDQHGSRPGDHTWDWYMRRALEMLVQADGVVLLPGWWKSKGATLEHRTAEALGMRVVLAPEEWLP